MNIFERTPGELSGDEIRAALGVLAEERDRAARAGDHPAAQRLNDILRVLAAERDARIELFRAVDDAPFAVREIDGPGRYDDDGTNS